MRARRSRLIGILTIAATLLFAAGAQADPAKIPVRVVVVTTFELGQDTGDTPGEFQAWVERLPLKQVLPFPAGNHVLRYNADKQVLGVVTGSGSINSAASIMALGLDPRFDLTKAYWVVSGIAGINPNEGSVGSAAWATWVVDRDLVHEIDAREIPPGWSTGLIPLTRSQPFQGPPPEPGIFSPNAYHLDPGLVDWAYRLTKDTPLADSDALKAIRAKYDQPAAQAPPRVMKGDEITANAWWVGKLMNKASEDWMRYWTGGQGVSVTTAMEDGGIIHALQMLAKAGLVDDRRVLVLRSASNYSTPGRGETAAQLVHEESSSDSATNLSAFVPSLEAGYRAGSRVVDALSSHWDQYRDHIPDGDHP